MTGGEQAPHRILEVADKSRKHRSLRTPRLPVTIR